MILRNQYEPNLHAENTALAIYQDDESAERIINASPLRFELGKLEGSSYQSDFVSTEEQEGKQAEAERIENEDRPFTQKMPEDEAQEEFEEARRPRPNRMTVEEAFAALKASTQERSIPDSEAMQIPTTPKPTKPFTPNPTPSNLSPASLPFPPSASYMQPAKPEPPREFHLTITRSVLNHHAYVQRQHYYGPFNLEWRSLMAADLKGRVPLEGMRDCDLGKPEKVLRFRLKMWERERERERADGGRGSVGLREIWERGQKARGEAQKGG